MMTRAWVWPSSEKRQYDESMVEVLMPCYSAVGAEIIVMVVVHYVRRASTL